MAHIVNQNSAWTGRHIIDPASAIYLQALLARNANSRPELGGLATRFVPSNLLESEDLGDQIVLP